MSEKKHTDGPWVAECFKSGAFRIVHRESGLVICDRAQYENRVDEMHANARLIAAAPELLKALKEEHNHYIRVDPVFRANHNEKTCQTCQMVILAEGGG